MGAPLVRQGHGVAPVEDHMGTPRTLTHRVTLTQQTHFGVSMKARRCQHSHVCGRASHHSDVKDAEIPTCG